MTDALSAAATWFSRRHGDDRDLSSEELHALAEDLAGQPGLWRSQVRHDEDERVFVRLHRDHHVDAWLICWVGTQETGLHDHDVSSGAVLVIEGALAELRPMLGQADLDVVTYAAGEGFGFDASRIHDVRHFGAEPTVSLHVYSPPLWRMGYYETGADGRLTRRSASYLDELTAS